MQRAALAILLNFLLGGALYAQYDLSLWTRSSEGKITFIPWYLYTGKGVCLDLRHNFDAEGSTAAFVGTSFGSEKLQVVPMAGVIVGKYRAVSPEILVLANTKRFQVFAQSQIALGFKGDGGGANPDFVYSWIDWLFNVRSWFALGVGEQTFKEFSPGSRPRIDIGPSAKFSMGRMYIRFWPMASLGPAARGHTTIVTAVGYTF